MSRMTQYDTHNFYPFFWGDEAFLAADVGFWVFWGLPIHLANMNGCFTLTKCGPACAAKMTLRSVDEDLFFFFFHFANLGFFFSSLKVAELFWPTFLGDFAPVRFVFFVFHGN